MEISVNNTNSIEQSKARELLGLLNSDTDIFVFKTSGSTGIPKEIQFTRKQLEISVDQTRKAFHLNNESHLVCPLSFDYIAGKMMLIRAYFLKCKLTLIEPTTIPNLNVLKEPVTLMSIVPLQLEAILNQNDGKLQLSRIKHLLVGGAPMSETLIKNTRNIPIQIWQSYGMTETLTHVALQNISEGERRFTALCGVELKTDIKNCLQIKSPISEQWISTTDIVRLSENTFEWLGRADNVINSGGHKIFPEQIEIIINSEFPDVNVRISSAPDELLGTKSVALYTGDITQVKKIQIEAILPKYAKPKNWLHVSKLPELENGKIDRLLLKKLASESF